MDLVLPAPTRANAIGRGQMWVRRGGGTRCLGSYHARSERASASEPSVQCVTRREAAKARCRAGGMAMSFPQRRLRRLRRPPPPRPPVAETHLSVDDLIAPLFVPDGIVQVALRDLRSDLGDELVIMADLCLDEYTDHGHCGVVDDDGQVANDATIDLYARVAVAQAEAGADVVAPSGMMDGQVAAIRGALDEAGFEQVAILAYAAKYASALYGPFREAVDVTIVGGGDRKAYQQDPRNGREALEEIRADLAEGADMVMVKPAVAYLDVLAAARAEVDVPLAAYHVSGEYAMVKAAAERGWIDGPAVMLEHLTAVRRAGADMILTYAAREVAESLR